MNNLVITFGATIIGAVIGALISFFVTTLSQRKMFTDISQTMIDVHVRIAHQHDMEDLIKQHEKGCNASKDITKLQKGLIFLVGQLGGDPKDIGLL